jgi:hypothetical protein
MRSVSIGYLVFGGVLYAVVLFFRTEDILAGDVIGWLGRARRGTVIVMQDSQTAARAGPTGLGPVYPTVTSRPSNFWPLLVSGSCFLPSVNSGYPPAMIWPSLGRNLHPGEGAHALATEPEGPTQ